MIYSEELEKLISEAVLDGFLTDKEKQELFKKAESFGIDFDEFEMVLEARLFEQKEKNKSKEKKVDKCPQCGAPVVSFATKCTYCGAEIKNVKSTNITAEFFDNLNAFEMQSDVVIQRETVDYTKPPQGFSSGCLIIVLWIFFPYIMFPIYLVKLITGAFKPANWTTYDSQKEEFIMNYTVPTDKEDILEFITLATDKIEKVSHFDLLKQTGKHKNRWNNIWIQKIEQIKSKVRTDGHYPEILPMSKKINRKQKGNNGKIIHIRFISFILLVAYFIGLFSLFNRREDIINHLFGWFTNRMIENTFKEYNIFDSNMQDGSAPVKMQLTILKLELEKVSKFIENKEYKEARILLEETKWRVIMDSIDDFNNREKPLIIQFLQQKQKVNNSLPEKFRITVESIEDYKVKQKKSDEIQ